MALARTDRGTVTRNTSETSWAITPPQTFTAGALVVMCLAYDNGGFLGSDPVGTITDSKGNEWVYREDDRKSGGAANDGVCGRIYECRQLAGQITTSDTITVPFGAFAVTSKVATFYEITFGAGNFPHFVGSASSNGTTGTPTITTPSMASGRVLIAMVGIEATVTVTPDADTSAGNWSTHQTNSAAGGIRISSQSKLTTSTATQTYNPTFTSNDEALLYAYWEEKAQASASAALSNQVTGSMEVTAQLDRQIVVGTDDASELASGGAMSLTNTVDNIGNGRHGGWRFQDVEIPKGSPIRNARLWLPSIKLDDFDLDLYANAADNAGTFTSSASNISGRTRTSATALWQLPNSGVGIFQSPQLRDVVREVTDRAGWSLGNALALVGIARSGDAFTIQNYEGDATGTAFLVLELGVTASASASLTGTGSLTATGTVIKNASAALTGTGSSTIAAQARLGGSAALSGAGALSATGTRTAEAQAALTGAGTLTGAANLRSNASTAALTGTGTLSASGARTAGASAALAGTGALTVTGTRTAEAAAALSGAGALTAAGLRTAVVTAALTGAGTLTADGEIVDSPVVEGAAALTGLGSSTIQATLVAHAAAALTGAGDLSATGTRAAEAQAALTGAGALTVTGVRTTKAQAALTGAGALTVSALRTAKGIANLSGTGALTVVGNARRSGIVALTGAGALTVSATRLRNAAAALTGTGALTASGRLTASAVVILTGTGDLVAAYEPDSGFVRGPAHALADGDLVVVVLDAGFESLADTVARMAAAADRDQIDAVADPDPIEART